MNVMIQRIQSIFLLAAGASSFGLLLLPTEGGGIVFAQLSGILSATIGGLSYWGAIFLFKNRLLQIKISTLGIVISLLILGLQFIPGPTGLANIAEASRPIAYLLPVIALLLGYAAIHFIRKDDKLVKSMDRLR
jgi:hypothetical protein